MTTHDRASRTLGRATLEGTARFRGRFSHLDPGHFRAALGLDVSSIGVGTYLGDPDAGTDRGYRESIGAAIARGCNVIDTAVNYRYQLSERAVGLAIQDALRTGTMRRDELVVCTKGGYLAFDGPPADARAWVQETFIDRGVIAWSDIVSYNVMHPAYIRHQIETSLDNLGLETIDLYYLHNPETQLQGVGRREFSARMVACFEELEAAVDAGTIGAYGVATWDAFRVGPAEALSVSLADLVRTAQAVAGEHHHFRAVQMPMNLGMPEAFVAATQVVDGSPISAIEAAVRLGLTPIASGSLMQGRLAELPEAFAALVPGLDTDAQRALQFARSTPGVAAALVGMKTPSHAHENLVLAELPPLSTEQYVAVFR